jgi:uncharacterized protein (TIGR02996 family)
LTELPKTKERTVMATQDELLQAIYAHPADWGRMLVYADWLEEHAAKELAYTYRWMGAHHKRPGASQIDNDGAETCGLEPGTAIWIWGSSSDTHENGSHDIPSVLITVMEEPQNPTKSPGRLLETETRAVFFPSLADAVHALADALEYIRKLHSLDELSG